MLAHALCDYAAVYHVNNVIFLAKDQTRVKAYWNLIYGKGAIQSSQQKHTILN